MDMCASSGADLLAVNADGNMPYDICEDEATLELLEMVMAEQGQWKVCEQINFPAFDRSGKRGMIKLNLPVIYHIWNQMANIYVQSQSRKKINPSPSDLFNLVLVCLVKG